MSTGDPAVPPASGSGEQIRTREFGVIRRGYDPQQVRDYLAAVGSHVDALERALRETRSRLAEVEAAPTADPYEQLSKRFAGVLSTADAEAEQIVDRARNEADRIKAEAQSRADDARMRTSQSLVNAQREADRMMESLSQRREVMLRQLHDMQSRLLAVADDLETAIRPPAPPPPSPPTASAPSASAVPVRDELDSPASPSAAPPSAPGPEPSASTPIEDLWVASGAAPAKSPAVAGDEVGLSELFEPPAGDVDLPDLSDLDLDLDIDADDGR